MSIFNKYPYTDFHEMNLDWLLREIKCLELRMSDFTVINKLIYAGAWDITKNYPPYNIVISDETGYISIKSVPAGISIYNSEYWVKIADFTAEMAAIVQQLDGLIEEVEGLDEIISRIPSDLNSKQNKLNSNSTCLLIGNSYSRGTGSYDSLHGWVSYFVNLVGCQYYAIMQNGGDFLRTGNSNATYPGMTYRNAIETWATDQDIETLDSIDYVIFGGGYNDWIYAQTDAGITSLKNEIERTITEVKTICPNAEIYVFPMSQSRCPDGVQNVALINAMYSWLDAAMITGVGGCDTYKITGQNTDAYYSADTIHLNEIGYKLLAEFMAAYINGFDDDPLFEVENTVLDADVTRVYESILRRGDDVTLTGGYNVSDIANGRVILTLPEKYRAGYTIYTYGYMFQNAGTQALIPLVITRDGQLIVRRDSYVTYPTDPADIYIQVSYKL